LAGAVCLSYILEMLSALLQIIIKPQLNLQYRKLNTKMFFNLKKIFSKDLKARQGVVAVELALIAPVFLYFLMGIIEVSLLLFGSTVVDGAAQSAARTIRTGSAQLSGDTLSAFNTELCSSLGGIYDCDDITLDVRTFDTFSAVTIPVLRINGNGDLVYDDEDDPINDDNDVEFEAEFTPGGASEINVVRVIYSWAFFTPFIGDVLADDGNSKYLSTTVVFRNEPYE
jgi:Flp pilus assembly protein TadG